MTEPVNNPVDARRCVQCGRVDSPIAIGPGPGWLALALWAASALLWALGMLLASTALSYLTALVFLAALLYTLWYFYRREKACRHCGGRDLETGAGGAVP